MSTKSRVSPEEFVQAWNSSESAQEVAEKLGMSLNAVRPRAQHYRSKGVNLKKMRRGTKTLDVESLNRLISESSPPVNGNGEHKEQEAPPKKTTKTKKKVGAGV